MIQGIWKIKNNTYVRENDVFKKINLKYPVFEKDKNGEYKDYTLKNNYKLREFTNLTEYNNYIKTYGDLKDIKTVSPTFWWNFNNRWKKDSFKNQKIIYMDIETIDLNDRKFPQPHLAEAPITHIQLLNSETNKVTILFTKDINNELKEKYNNVNFVLCKDEKDLLKKYSLYIKKVNASIITAYNGDFFDFPYIFFRSIKLGLDPNIFSPLNDYEIKVEFKLEDGSYKKYYKLNDILEFIKTTDSSKYKMNKCYIEYKGYYQLDYLVIFKKFNFDPLPKFSLEYVTYKYLKEGDGKISYKQYDSIHDFYEKDYDGFTEYSIRDVEVLRDLENKFKYFSIVTQLSLDFVCNFNIGMETLQPWNSRLSMLFLEQNIIPPKDDMKGEVAHITGGYVRNPIKDKHEWVMIFDYNSMHPSSMVATNTCVTTYISPEELSKEAKEIYDIFRDQDEEHLFKENIYNKMKEVCKKDNITFSGTSFYKRDRQGIISKDIEDIYYGRKIEKQKMLLANVVLSNIEKDIKDNSFNVKEIINKIENNEINWDNVYEIRISDKENVKLLEEYSELKETKQKVEKLKINSIYGALNNKYFPFSNFDIGAGIVFMSRYIIKRTGYNLVEKTKRFYKHKNIEFEDYKPKLENNNPEFPIINEYKDKRWIYADTDAVDISFKELALHILKGRNYNDLSEEEKKKFIDKLIQFADKIIQPEIDNIVNKMAQDFNYRSKGFAGAKLEQIISSGIWVAKKKYAKITNYDEGSYFLDGELTVKGLEIVRSSTPEYAKDVLSKSLEIMLIKNENDLQNYIHIEKQKFMNKIGQLDFIPKISRITGVNGLNYIYDGDKFKKEIKDSNGNYKKSLSAPMNSRASILYNKLVKDNNLEEKYPFIEERDKIMMVHLNINNPIIKSEIIAFKDENFLKDIGLLDWIDYNMQWLKIIEQPLQSLSDTIKWSFEKKLDLF